MSSTGTIGKYHQKFRENDEEKLSFFTVPLDDSFLEPKKKKKDFRGISEKYSNSSS